MFIAVLFTTAKTWKQPKCPLREECIKKIWYIYLTKYNPVIKKNEIMSFAATSIDLIIILTEASQRERQTSYNIAYRQNIKK